MSLDIAEAFDSLLASDADPVGAGVLIQKLADIASRDQLVGDESSVPLAESMASGNLVGKRRDVMPAVHWIGELARRQSLLPDADPAVLGGILRLVHVHVLRHGEPALHVVNTNELRRVIEGVSPEVPNRHLLMHLLASKRDATSLSVLVELLQQSPPHGWMAAAQVISPLMQHRDWSVEAVYPQILNCLSEPVLASSVLDLTGHLYRTHRVDPHPAADRLSSLNELLSGVTDRLARFEEAPSYFGDDVDQVQAILAEAVALAVSLCDCVGLIGESSSIAPLRKALDLKHRRVRCEAAGALARLGDAHGRSQLLKLTSEPSARLRAIAYADELGIGEQVDDAYREPGATSEAEMALWLSQPQQMGVPPTSVEVIDSRRILWPSFTDPVDVTLVRFEYNFGERCYSNVGLTGPAVFTFATDVADLPVEDIYAMYAGWHAEHDDIFTVAAKEFNEAQARMVEPFRDHLQRLGYDEVEVTLLGFFLDETAGIFTARRDETHCVVVTDGSETIDLPTEGRMRPATSEDVFQLYKGRKMLRTFNPQGI
ncbi:MAG: HEAT repeat domain-containing protein [Planctomycetota bacterium]